MPSVRVLCVDDDMVALRVLAKHLERAGAKTILLTDATQAVASVREHRPHLVMLDASMPQLDGYAVAEQLRRDPLGEGVPVIFVTASDREVDRRRALALGAADFLTKPVTGRVLLETVRRHLVAAYGSQAKGNSSASRRRTPIGRFIAEELGLGDEAARAMAGASADTVYEVGRGLGLVTGDVAQLLAKYADVPYLCCPSAMARDLELLPDNFCRERRVVLLHTLGGGLQVVVANPLDLELVDVLRARLADRPFTIAVADPAQLDFVLATSAGGEEIDAAVIAEHLLHTAAAERASDIHLEPKEQLVAVNLRVDGEMRPAMTLSHLASLRLVSRLKLEGNLDIAEKRRPQDGSCLARIGDRDYKLRLATAPTPHGESLTIRLLAANAEAPDLDSLGMTEGQADQLRDMILQNSGLILIVGTTGSGKSTTAYSLLANLEHRARSVLTIEDPVEYRIPFANQQQVNEKAGVTFATLLRAAVRQDPDVLFLGEVRDQDSAQTATYMASTGHLTVATMHTADAASAVSRLERLGTDRRTLADSLLGLVAQRLLKRLCATCRRMVNLTDEQAGWFDALGAPKPDGIGVAPGCEHCGGRGFRGRVGVYEILSPDAGILEQLRQGASVPEIRRYLRDRGQYMMGHHAITLLSEGVIGIDDAREVIGSCAATA